VLVNLAKYPIQSVLISQVMSAYTVKNGFTGITV